MASTVALARNFSTSNVSFSQIKVNEVTKAKSAYVNYNGGKFLFQTPSLSLPFGMSVYDKAGPIKYSVEMSLRGYDEAGSKIKEFYDAIHSLDEYMISEGIKNSKAWFKSDLTPEVVRAFYTPIIKRSSDKDGKAYPPNVKVTLRKNGEAFDIKMYDTNKEEYHGVPIEDLLVRGAVMRCVMQCTGIWFAGGKFGLSWKAAQIVMDKVPDGVRGYAFVDEDVAEDDSAFSAPVTTKAPAPAPAPAPAQPLVQDDEDLDDGPDDVEPIPLPKRPAVVTKPSGGAGPAPKKVIRK
jgi:hypothetical protein